MNASAQSFASRPYSPNGSAGTEGFQALPGPATVASIQGRRLPREGPERGGGRMSVHNRDILQKGLWDCETPGGQDSELPVGLTNRRGHGRRSSPAGGSQTSKSQGQKSSQSEAEGGSPQSAAGSQHGSSHHHGPARKLSPAERKRVEVRAKWEKLNEQRDKVQKDIHERIEKQRGMREERVQRLTSSLACRDNLAAATAVALLERDSHEQQRRRALYEAWNERVYQPLSKQAYDHMNPTNRQLQQGMTRSKSVSFDLQSEPKKLIARVDGCPVRKPLVELAREAAFHMAASHVLGHSQSAPDLRYHQGGSVVPRAKSRPTLEPSLWGQVKLSGTSYAQPTKGKRGGDGVHIPDESDGVLTCGKRNSRVHGYGDVGILRGSMGNRGESSAFFGAEGASSAAPMQDHYTYQSGDYVTSLEFPPGKRTFAEFA